MFSSRSFKPEELISIEFVCLEFVKWKFMLIVEVMKIEIAILRNEKIKKLKKKNSQNVNIARSIKKKHVENFPCLKQSTLYDK